MDYASADTQSDDGFLGISREAWARVLVITALFAAVFWPNLRRLWLKTNPFTGEPNWSHAICVPVIGLYYLFIHRENLLKAHSSQFIWGSIIRPGRGIASAIMIVCGAAGYFLTKDSQGIANSIVLGLSISTGVLGVLVLVLDWSIATMLFGLGMFVYGIYPGRNDYLKDVGMITTLFGMVLLLCGWNVMRIAWFPIVFLICALPWPGLVYSWVAEPLSGLAAHVAVGVLKATGVDSVCSGTKIIILNADLMKPPRVLNVAEACAGMRSLMTFIAVAGAVAFLSARPLWQKLIIVFSAIPIAIFCNVMRISGQGLLDHYVSPEWSESFAHQFVGMMMLLPAFFLILGVGFVLDKAFIEEAEEGDSRYIAPLKSVAAITPQQTPIPRAGMLSAMSASAAVAQTTLPTSPSAPRPIVATPAVAARSASTPAAVTPAAPTPAAAAAPTPPRPMTAANLRPRVAPPTAPPLTQSATQPANQPRMQPSASANTTGALPARPPASAPASRPPVRPAEPLSPTRRIVPPTPKKA